MDDQSRRGRGLAAALVCLVTVVAFETMSVATIMPEVRADIGGLSLYGWAFSGLALGEVIGIVVAGSWADREGVTLCFLRDASGRFSRLAVTVRQALSTIFLIGIEAF